MALAVFAISLGFAILVAIRKRIPLLSPYVLFCGFQALYNLVPLIVSWLGVSSLSLLPDLSVIDTQLFLAASANLCFGVMHAVFYSPLKNTSEPEVCPDPHRRNFVLWSTLLFLLTCIMVRKYGWNALTIADPGVAEPAGGMFTLTSYIKNSFVAIYLYYLYRYGVDKWAWALLAGHAFVVIIDGARTSFLPLFLLTLVLFRQRPSPTNKRRTVFALAICGIVASVLARSIVLEGGSLFEKVLAPITAEGLFGSYPSLQAISIVSQANHPNLTYGTSYIVDPIVWLMPQGASRNNHLFFQSWVANGSTALDEDFGPMGGFYYIAESVAAFAYFGPALVTTVYAMVLIWMERNRDRYRLLYVLWMPTCGMLFVKMIFGNVVKLFIVQLVFVGLLVYASRLRRFLRVLPPKELVSDVC